jgi:hypothetical protein
MASGIRLGQAGVTCAAVCIRLTKAKACCARGKHALAGRTDAWAVMSVGGAVSDRAVASLVSSAETRDRTRATSRTGARVRTAIADGSFATTWRMVGHLSEHSDATRVPRQRIRIVVVAVPGRAATNENWSQREE